MLGIQIFSRIYCNNNTSQIALEDRFVNTKNAVKVGDNLFKKIDLLGEPINVFAITKTKAVGGADKKKRSSHVCCRRAGRRAISQSEGVNRPGFAGGFNS
jgi:hypothetical protein